MEAVHKITLSSGKVVLLREPKMKHMRMAEKLAGGKMDSLVFTEELVKQLIAKVDDTDIKKPDLLDVDELFSVAEFLQVSQVAQSLMGNGPEAKPKVEQVFGGK